MVLLLDFPKGSNATPVQTVLYDRIQRAYEWLAWVDVASMPDPMPERIDRHFQLIEVFLSF